MFLVGDLEVCGSGGGCGVFNFASEFVHISVTRSHEGGVSTSYLAALIRLLLRESQLKLSGKVHLFSPISTMHKGEGSHVPFQGETSVSILHEYFFS